MSQKKLMSLKKCLLIKEAGKNRNLQILNKTIKMYSQNKLLEK